MALTSLRCRRKTEGGYENERATILEALLGNYSQLETTLSPIINTLPLAAPPVSSSVIEVESPTAELAAADTPICGDPSATYSGRQLFSPPTTPAASDVSRLTSDADVIKELSVKVLAGKEEKTYILRNVCVAEVSSIELMKNFLGRTFELQDIQEFGYFIKRKKVWLREDEELRTVVREHLGKGKGALWCVEKHVDLEPTQTDETPVTSKRRKTTILEEKRERVEAIYQELRSKHGGRYSGPQCRLWAEAIDVGRHTSKEEPPLGTLFHNVTKSNNSAMSEVFVDLAKTVISVLKGNKSPPKQVASSPACITPVRAAGLRSTFIQHIKDLHNLYEAGALSQDEYETQKGVVLRQMGDL